MKKIVISAINFRDGGTLATLQDCLEYVSSDLADRYEIVALVSDARLFNNKKILLLLIPSSKKSWALRLYFEYLYFWFFSKRMKPYLWLSFHDITPNVRSDIRAVYAHNPSPFYKLPLREACFDFTIRASKSPLPQFVFH